ncbi:hypothetical protein WJX77_001720 [Trebouxia sp. C0004]
MSHLLRADGLKAWNKLLVSTRSAHDQEKWKSATAHCEELLDVLRSFAQKDDLSADLPSDLGALCLQAGETAYLLALALCQHGKEDLADTILTRLNCTHRLAPAVLMLNEQVMPATASANSLDAFLPCVIRDAVSEELFRQLRSGLSAAASFWTDHLYFEPETPFFSYFYQLDSNPGTVIDAAIQELHSLLLGSACGPCMTGVTSAEWWAHCREPDEPHQLHFDLREAALRQGLQHYQLQHPLVSSVLFLTESGGPTFVLDQDPQGPLAPRGWLVQPYANQLLAFKGNLLHGVIPGRPNDSTADRSSQQQLSGGKRITLIVAWWGPDMRAEPGHHTDYNRLQDSAHRHDVAVSKNCRRTSHDYIESRDCTNLRKLSEHHPVTLSPVWLPVGSLQQQDKQQADAKRPRLNDRQDKQQQQQQQQQLPLPPLRFFIQSLHEFASVYLPGKARAQDCE